MSFRFSFALALSLAACWVLPAEAGSRRFTYIYEVDVMGKGEVEFEQYITHKAHKRTDPDFDRFDVKHEVEWGLGGHLQAAVFGTWQYHDGGADENGRVTFQTVAGEMIYQLASPIKEPLGAALYGEIGIGDQKAELEFKLLLQKNIGKWVLAWNGILEAEWEGSHYTDDNGEVAQVLGASYQINPAWSIGCETLHEIAINDWETAGDLIVYAGPKIAYRGRGWFATVTMMPQLTTLPSEPNLQTRLIAGIDF